jgi:hypothetical protein
MMHRYTAPFLAVLVLALAAFTGSALAGNGTVNGSGGENGNSANAPGHQTTQAPAPAAPAAAAAPVAAKHQSTVKQSKQSQTSAANPATSGTNAHGVKPSNTTSHNSYATASSGETKLYGNGKTAGQIATQAGYGNAVLHGPGNSQPHKTVPCGGKHEVDVHALKNKASTCGSTQPAGASAQGASTANGTPAASVAAATATPATSVAASTATPAAAAAPVTAQAAPVGAGGVLGAAVALKPAKAKPAGGVLGATARLGGTVAATRLPFTGLPLWIFAVAALALIGTGLAFRRASLDPIQ